MLNCSLSLDSDLDQFQLGTLSHMINAKAHDYQELPDWPEVAPDPSVRNVEVAIPWTETKTSKKKQLDLKKKKSFYSDEESSSPAGKWFLEMREPQKFYLESNNPIFRLLFHKLVLLVSDSDSVVLVCQLNELICFRRFVRGELD